MDFLSMYGEEEEEEEEEKESGRGGKDAAGPITSHPAITAPCMDNARQGPDPPPNLHGSLPPPDFDAEDPNAKPSTLSLKRAIQPTAIERAGLNAGPSKVARTAGGGGGGRVGGGGAAEGVAPRSLIHASQSMMMPPQLKGRSNVVTEDLSKYGLVGRKEGATVQVRKEEEEMRIKD